MSPGIRTARSSPWQGRSPASCTAEHLDREPGRNRLDRTSRWAIPAREEDPDWAPDGSKIVFATEATAPTTGLIRSASINADGSQQDLISPVRPSRVLSTTNPIWVTGRLADRVHRAPILRVWTVEPDGTDPTNLTAATGEPRPPGSPSPQNAYARPQGARPRAASLVIAYRPMHRPGQHPRRPARGRRRARQPGQELDHLTVGTADANGKPALNEGSSR